MAAMTRSPFLVMLALGASVLAGCHNPRPDSGSGGAPARIAVSRISAPIDVPVSVTVTGLPAGQPVTVSLSGTDRVGVRWSSSAQFRATPAGTVSLNQSALGGSYTGVHPMGLFELMAPPDGTPDSDGVFATATDDRQLSLAVSLHGRTLATTTIDRWRPRPASESFSLQRNGIIGTAYLPASPGSRRPAILMFGGSEGGEAMGFNAALAASHGYPALALAYFKEPGLPQTLTGVDLDYFVRALTILRSLPDVDPNRVLVYGVSRGSEAALLLDSHFPSLVNGVIAGVPSSVTQRGYPDPTRPAWLLHGVPLPSAPYADWDQPDPSDAQAAVIPVERIRGPVLMTCGGADNEWSSCGYEQAIVARLKAHHFAYPITALSYLTAGHGVGDLSRYDPYAPSIYTELGGDPLASMEGSADGYSHLLSLLGSLARG
jgi:dienelactone hydrolase